MDYLRNQTGQPVPYRSKLEGDTGLEDVPQVEEEDKSFEDQTFGGNMAVLCSTIRSSFFSYGLTEPSLWSRGILSNICV